MTTPRFAARPRARFAIPIAVFASSSAILAIAALSACGGSDADEDAASKNYIGATDAEPPRLGPRDVDAGTRPSR